MTVAALFLLALALRLALLPAPGNTSDIAGLTAFGAAVASHGPGPLYDRPETFGAQYVIPPLFPLVLGATFRLWTSAAGGAPPYAAAAAIIKLFAVVGDIAVGLLLYRWVRARAGERWALVCAGAYLFSPGVVYESAWWGQIDSLLVLSVAGAWVALAHRRVALAWVILAVGGLLKPQALVCVPLIAWLTVRSHGVRAIVRGTAAAAGLVLLVTVPYWSTGRGRQLLAVYAGAVDFYPRVSVNADNLWRAVAGPAGGIEWLPDTADVLPGITYRLMGLSLLGAYLALVLWAMSGAPTPRHRPPTSPGTGPEVWLAGLACLYLAFFMLPTQIHERYLYAGTALLCFVLYRYPVVAPLYGLLAVAFFANLVRVVPWDPRAAALAAAAGLGPWPTALSNTFAFAAVTALLLLRLPPRALALPGAALVAAASVLAQGVPPVR